MIVEILGQMEERRIAKLKNNIVQYNILYRGIRNKIRRAREKLLEEQCEEADRLHEKHDSFKFHKKFKEITECFRDKNTPSIRQNNKILTDSNEIRMACENILKPYTVYVEDIRWQHKTKQNE